MNDQPTSKTYATLWCSVKKDIASKIRKLASAQGITISEYLRKLVIQDLDGRTVFTDQLKEAVGDDGTSSASGQPVPQKSPGGD